MEEQRAPSELPSWLLSEVAQLPTENAQTSEYAQKPVPTPKSLSNIASCCCSCCISPLRLCLACTISSPFRRNTSQYCVPDQGGESSSTSGVVPVQSKKTHRAWWCCLTLVGVVVCAAATLGVGAYMLLSEDGTASQPPPPSPSPGPLIVEIDQEVFVEFNMHISGVTVSCHTPQTLDSCCSELKP